MASPRISDHVTLACSGLGPSASESANILKPSDGVAIHPYEYLQRSKVSEFRLHLDHPDCDTAWLPCRAGTLNYSSNGPSGPKYATFEMFLL